MLLQQPPQTLRQVPPKRPPPLVHGQPSALPTRGNARMTEQRKGVPHVLLKLEETAGQTAVEPFNSWQFDHRHQAATSKVSQLSEQQQLPRQAAVPQGHQRHGSAGRSSLEARTGQLGSQAAVLVACPCN